MKILFIVLSLIILTLNSISLAQTRGQQDSETTIKTLDISQYVLITPIMFELENDTRFPLFYNCKVFTNPKLPTDFGLNVQYKNKKNTVDETLLIYYKMQAETFQNITGIMDEKQITQYANCLYHYGEILKQSLINIQSDGTKFNYFKNSNTLNTNISTIRVWSYSQFSLTKRS